MRSQKMLRLSFLFGAGSLACVRHGGIQMFRVKRRMTGRLNKLHETKNRLRKS